MGTEHPLATISVQKCTTLDRRKWNFLLKNKLKFIPFIIRLFVFIVIILRLRIMELFWFNRDFRLKTESKTVTHTCMLECKVVETFTFSPSDSLSILVLCVRARVWAISVFALFLSLLCELIVLSCVTLIRRSLREWFYLKTILDYFRCFFSRKFISRPLPITGITYLNILSYSLLVRF